MDKFRKERAPTEGKGESEDIDWITANGSHIPIKKGQNKERAVAEFSAKRLKKEGKRGIVRLPEPEYAEFCSTIKSLYADKIPPKGTVSLANDFYMFTYDREQELILCKFKVSIEGNEKYIEAIRRKYDN